MLAKTPRHAYLAPQARGDDQNKRVHTQSHRPASNAATSARAHRARRASRRRGHARSEMESGRPRRRAALSLARAAMLRTRATTSCTPSDSDRRRRPPHRCCLSSRRAVRAARHARSARRLRKNERREQHERDVKRRAQRGGVHRGGLLEVRVLVLAVLAVVPARRPNDDDTPRVRPTRHPRRRPPAAVRSRRVHEQTAAMRYRAPSVSKPHAHRRT